MRIYRVEYNNTDGNCGASWHASKAEAERNARDFVKRNTPEPPTGDVLEDMYRPSARPLPPTIEPVEFTPTKRGVLDLLDHYAIHPDNG